MPKRALRTAFQAIPAQVGLCPLSSASGDRLLHSSRAALLATACALPMFAELAWTEAAHAQAAAPTPATRSAVGQSARSAPRAASGVAGKVARQNADGTIATIKVTGNQRIETGTIRSYMLVQVGDDFDPDRIDRSIKTLFATGLFQDVTLNRDGNTLLVKVVENPIINRIAFDGNKKLTDDQLRGEMQLHPRSVYTPQMVSADRQRLLDLYAKRGRFAATVDPKIIHLDQNRVDVVFEISEGETTLMSRIAIIGNHAFSEKKLREVINSREEAFYRVLSDSDEYNPEKINFDKELLRRFYLKNGYADVDIKDPTAELSPDRRAFFITFNIVEGSLYTVNSVKVESKLKNLEGDQLRSLVPISSGDTYDGDLVEKTVQSLQDAVQTRGYAFVDVQPKIARDKEKKTVDLVFEVGEGPRVYIERIDIVGNTRTKDKVIRREFRLAEGDAFNAANIRRSRQRLLDLGYFNSVVVAPSQGSAPDRAIITTNIDEKATGELTLGGGYSTDSGALLQSGLRERNMVGTGIDGTLNGVLAQLSSQLTLSVTDPYFLDRNLVAGFDIFHTDNNNQNIASYSERRTGGSLRLGYEFNEHLRQAWNYTIVERNVYNIQSGASIYVLNQTGASLLSQVGQTLTVDYRDSRTDPHDGFLASVGTDFAGLGGTAHYVRTKIDVKNLFSLERYLGDPEWVLAVSAGAGYLVDLGGYQELIIDRFFLGGDNLRGFLDGGVGPHAVGPYSIDSLGGRFIYTQSTELRFPLPISADLGLTGRTFVDVGGLSQINRYTTGLYAGTVVYDDPGPRVSTGVGLSWKTPFGLINIDFGIPIIKKRYDQLQVFRFGFGTRF